MTTHGSLRLLCLLALAAAEPAPAPGRVPKVYNALITSNQNLEPSKAYPVYQPVIHDPFAYPFQPAVYYGGDFPLSNGLNPSAGVGAKQPPQAQPPQSPPADAQPENKPPAEAPPSPQPSSSDADPAKPTPAPPLPPNTQSPIPLNEYGLPAQVLPLGRFNPAYDGFTQVGAFPYTYPGFRFYDPYDPYSLGHYPNLSPFYRPLPNVLGPVAPPQAIDRNGNVPAASSGIPQPAGPEQQGAEAPQSPPPEPNDLNVLNYAAKDPAIPNVPPPPLPQGGLKSDDAK